MTQLLLKSQASRIDCKYKTYSYTTELGLHESNNDTIQKRSLIAINAQCSIKKKSTLLL